MKFFSCLRVLAERRSGPYRSMRNGKESWIPPESGKIWGSVRVSLAFVTQSRKVVSRCSARAFRCKASTDCDQGEARRRTSDEPFGIQNLSYLRTYRPQGFAARFRR